MKSGVSESNGGNGEVRALGAIEIEAIEMFINFLRMLGLPKSIGEIYGLLFISPRALTMEELMVRLGMSMGAASQGLKLLRSFGAVKVVYAPGERRDHFAADLELSRFASAFIKDQLRPKLDRALERLRVMERALDDLPPSERAATRKRLARLRHWLDRGSALMPLALKILTAA